jgi:hypothetical protein
MIICDAYGGLNDRLKHLISCMRLDAEIKLIWTVKENSVHLWCPFEDLFTNNFETFDQYTKSECYKLYPSAKLYRGHQFITICYKDGSKIDLNQLALVDSGNSIPVIVKNNILDTINKLEPVEYIRKSVDELKSKFNDDTITVSIRTYLDAERNIHSNGRFFDINKVFEKMDNELYGDRLFFVTCDHQETFEEVLNRYGDRIIYTPKRTYFGDYKTTEGIQDCVIDLLLGGQSKHMISTNGSGFSEMQWWFGGGKSTIEVVYSHSHLANDRR